MSPSDRISPVQILQAPCDEGVGRAVKGAAPCRPGMERWVLAATILGSSMAFIDGTAVNVALPALQADLGATVAEVQWVVEAYALFLSALLLVGGVSHLAFGQVACPSYAKGGPRDSGPPCCAVSEEGLTGLPERLVPEPTSGAGRDVNESVSRSRLPKKGDCVAKGELLMKGTIVRTHSRPAALHCARSVTE